MMEMVSQAQFSANTGFLWRELPFTDRIRAAAAAGFDAVEFHDEAQGSDLTQIRDILAETGLPVCGLNVRMGATAGCAALPGHEDQARRDVDEALRVAEALGAGAVHVLAGRTSADADRAAYTRVLRHALDAGDRTILIEPISRAAIPDYFLHDISEAAALIDEISHARLKILFDCFHIAMEGGEIQAAFDQHAARIGHVQIASVPDRHEPGTEDDLDPASVIGHMQRAGYQGPFGCEYHPRSSVEAGLSWRAGLRNR